MRLSSLKPIIVVGALMILISCGSGGGGSANQLDPPVALLDAPQFRYEHLTKMPQHSIVWRHYFSE